jgi:integrase/recombinase XerD
MPTILKDWFCYLSGRDLAWDEVTLEDVGSFVAWLRLPPQGRDGTVAVLTAQAHHCGASTVNRKLAAVVSFYRFHARHGVKAGGVLRVMQAPGRGYAGTAFRPFLHHVTGKNPQPRLAAKVTAARPLPRVLSAAEAQAVLDACGRLRDRLLLGMLLDTGSARPWGCGTSTSTSAAAWCAWSRGTTRTGRAPRAAGAARSRRARR